MLTNKRQHCDMHCLPSVLNSQSEQISKNRYHNALTKPGWSTELYVARHHYSRDLKTKKLLCVLWNEETQGRLMARGLVFSPHGAQRSWFSLITSLLRELHLSQGYNWNNKASLPGHCVHLLYAKKLPCLRVLCAPHHSSPQEFPLTDST